MQQQPFAKFKRVLATEFQYPENYTLVAEAGAQSSIVYQYNCPRPSASNQVIQCPPPGPKCVMSRNVNWYNSYSVIFTGENTSSLPFIPPGSLAPRPLSMQGNCINLQMMVNSTPVECSNQKDIYPYLYEADNSEAAKNSEWSLAASQTCNSTQALEYPDYMFSLRNPCSQSFDQTSIGVPNGAFPGFEVISSTATSAEVRYSFYEPLILSPFQAGGGSFEAGTITGIDTLQFSANYMNLHKSFNANWKSDADGLPRIDFGDGTYQKITGALLVEDTMTASIRIKWYTMLPEVARSLPMSITLPQFTWTKNVQTFSVNLAPGDTTNISYNSLETMGVPEDFWLLLPTVSLQDRDSTFIGTMNKPFGVLGLGNFPVDPDRVLITLTHNTTSQMQSYRMIDIYHDQVSLGYNKSFSEFCGLISGTNGGGCPIRLRPGKSFQMDDGTAPGCTGKNTWNIQISIRNTLSHSIVNQDFLIYTRNIGYIQLGSGDSFQAAKNINLFDPNEVIAEPIVGGGAGSEDIEWAAGGKFGDFFTKSIPSAIKSMWKAKVLSTALGVAATKYPQLQVLADGVRALGGSSAQGGGMQANYDAGARAGGKFIPQGYRGGFVQEAQR